MFAIDDIKCFGRAAAGEGFLVQSIAAKSGTIDARGATHALFALQKASTGQRTLLVRGALVSNQSYAGGTALTSAVSVAMSTATNWGVKLDLRKLGGWPYLVFKNSGVACKTAMTVILAGQSPTPTSTRGFLGFTEYGK